MNAVILKFTEQIGPYFGNLFKRKKLVEKSSNEGKVSEVIQQLRTSTPFPVCCLGIHIILILKLFKSN